MRRLIGIGVYADNVVQMAPVGYLHVHEDIRFCPGRVLHGPWNDMTTTVCLLDGDDGEWFKDLVSQKDGHWRLEESPDGKEVL